MTNAKLTPTQQALVEEMRTTGCYIRDFLGRRTVFNSDGRPMRSLRDSVFHGLQDAGLLVRSPLRDSGHSRAYILNRKAL